MVCLGTQAPGYCVFSAQVHRYTAGTLHPNPIHHKTVYTQMDIALGVYELRSDARVCNVNMSGNDHRYKECRHPRTKNLYRSWIEFHAGESDTCIAQCCIAGCGNRAQLGLHIHVDEASCEHNYILPGCGNCNNEKCFDYTSDGTRWKKTKPGAIAVKIIAHSIVCKDGVPFEAKRSCPDSRRDQLSGLFNQFDALSVNSVSSVLESSGVSMRRNTEVAIYFGTQWCKHCKNFEPVLHKAIELIENLEILYVFCEATGKNANFNKKNFPEASQHHSRWLIQKYRVDEYPTCVLYSHGNEPIMDGVEELSRLVKSISSRQPRRQEEANELVFSEKEIREMNMEELRALIKKAGWNIKTSGYGRTKDRIIEDILKAG